MATATTGPHLLEADECDYPGAGGPGGGASNFFFPFL